MKEFKGLKPEQFTSYIQQLGINARTVCYDMNISESYLSNYKNGKSNISHIAQAALYYYSHAKALELNVVLKE